MKRTLNSILRWMSFLVFSALLLTLFFHWRLNTVSTQSQLSNIDSWAISLDISLAHLVVTFPLLLATIYFLRFTFRLIAKITDRMTDQVGDSLNRNKEKNELLPWALPVIWISTALIMCLLVLYGMFRLDKLLIIDTTDLQNYIFGQYDPSLGFVYPTSYRFTYIIDNFEIFRQNIVANSTFSKIFSGIGAIAVLISILVSISKVVDYISEKIR